MAHHFIAVCIPLMELVHSYNSLSKDISFIDASGSMGRFGYQVINVISHSKIEGSSEHEIEEGFMLWKSIFPNNAFYGLEEKGPITVKTDNALAERNAVNQVFPECDMALSTFHVLQALWRFLWEGKTVVTKV